MHVQYAAGEGIEKHGRDETHVAGKCHGIHPGGSKFLHHASVEGFTVGKCLVVEAEVRNAVPLGAVEHRRSRAVRYDDADVRIQLSGFSRVYHGLGVGAAARGENAELEGHARSLCAKAAHTASSIAGLVNSSG